MGCAIAVWVLSLLLVSCVPDGLQAEARGSPRLPMAVNISVFYSDVTQEAHVSCAYISSPPIYPTIRVNQISHAVRTLNDTTPSLNIQDCYNELTMLNVLTIVLHSPRLYVGSVFECYFLLHGGVQVSSGPATVTLTPTEGVSPPLCSEEEETHASIAAALPSSKCHTCTASSTPEPVKTSDDGVASTSQIRLFNHEKYIPAASALPSSQVLFPQNVTKADLRTGSSAKDTVNPLLIVGIVFAIVLLAMGSVLLLSVVFVVHAKKNKCRKKTSSIDDYSPPPHVQSVPIRRNPSYEPVKPGQPFSTSSRGGNCNIKEVVAGPRLPRESYNNVQLKNFPVIPSSCKPLSVAPRVNDYEKTATASQLTAGGFGPPPFEVHVYEEVDLKRSYTVIPTPGIGNACGNGNPEFDIPVEQNTVIVIDGNSPEMGKFRPRRATLAACYHVNGTTHPPSVPRVTEVPVTSHCNEPIPLYTGLGEETEASEDRAQCSTEGAVHKQDVASVDDGLDEAVGSVGQAKMCESEADATYDYI